MHDFQQLFHYPCRQNPAPATNFRVWPGYISGMPVVARLPLFDAVLLFALFFQAGLLLAPTVTVADALAVVMVALLLSLAWFWRQRPAVISHVMVTVAFGGLGMLIGSLIEAAGSAEQRIALHYCIGLLAASDSALPATAVAVPWSLLLMLVFCTGGCLTLGGRAALLQRRCWLWLLASQVAMLLGMFGALILYRSLLSADGVTNVCHQHAAMLAGMAIGMFLVGRMHAPTNPHPVLGCADVGRAGQRLRVPRPSNSGDHVTVDARCGLAINGRGHRKRRLNLRPMG